MALINDKVSAVPPADPTGPYTFYIYSSGDQPIPAITGGGALTLPSGLQWWQWCGIAVGIFALIVFLVIMFLIVAKIIRASKHRAQ